MEKEAISQLIVYDVQTYLIFAAFIFLCFMCIEKFLRAFKFRLDSKLCLGLIPFIMFAACLRVLEDQGKLKGLIFITPYVQILAFLIGSFALFLSLWLEKKLKIPYNILLMFFGLSILFPFLVKLNFSTIYPLLLILFFSSPWIGFFHSLELRLEDRLLLSLYAIDSFVGIISFHVFGYSFVHPLTGFLVEPFPFLYLGLKLGLIALIIKSVERCEENFKNLLKLTIGCIAGFTSARGILRLITT